MKKPLLILFLFPSFNYAQNSTFGSNQLNTQVNRITTAVPFLLIAPDARSSSMGETGTGTSPDANSLYWNPAKYTFIEKQSGISVSYSPWLRSLTKDNFLGYISFYQKLKKYGVIASSFRYFSHGEITLIDVAGKSTYQLKPNELALDVAYSQKLAKRWSGGVAFRYISSNLTEGKSIAGYQTHTGKSVGADISAYYFNDDLTINKKDADFLAGINISNLGPKISFGTEEKYFLPAAMRLGCALNISMDDYNDIVIVSDLGKLLVPTPPVYEMDASGFPKKDANGNYIISQGKDPQRSVASGIFGSFSDAPGGFKEEVKEVTGSLGMEYWYAKQFAVRGGYFYEDKTKGGRRFFTLGLGFKVGTLAVDFSYLLSARQNSTPLSNTLRLTAQYNFGKKPEQQSQNTNN